MRHFGQVVETVVLHSPSGTLVVDGSVLPRTSSGSSAVQLGGRNGASTTQPQEGQVIHSTIVNVAALFNVIIFDGTGDFF
jgi:hypothetical protein